MTCAGPRVAFWCSLWVPSNSGNLMNAWLWNESIFRWAQQDLFCPSTVPCCSRHCMCCNIPCDGICAAGLTYCGLWKSLLEYFPHELRKFPSIGLSKPARAPGRAAQCEMWCGQAQLGLPVTRATNPMGFPLKIPLQGLKQGILLWMGFFHNFSWC